MAHRMAIIVLTGASLLPVKICSGSSNDFGQNADAAPIRAEVFKLLQDPVIPDLVRTHYSDSQVLSLHKILDEFNTRQESGRLHVTTEPFPGILPSIEAHSVKFPCSYHGVMRSVAPWGPLGLNPCNTKWALEIPLDLRGITKWTTAREVLETQMADACNQVVPNPALNKRGVTVEFCTQDLLSQVDLFVGGMCNRAEETRSPFLDTGAEVRIRNVEACTNPTPFDTICRLAGTDKSSHYHGFAAFYDQEISRMRSPPTSILEVGVLRGASLGAWAAKFPCADVVGIDNFVVGNEDFFYPGRYRVVEANQEDPASLLAATAGQSFDIVIDDGGHTMLQQQNTLEALWPNVNPCGLFIMEDLHTSFPKQVYEQYRDFSPTTMDLIAGVVHSNASTLVDYGKVLSETLTVELFHPHEDHATAVFHKKC